jgi:hypothetical protein
VVRSIDKSARRSPIGDLPMTTQIQGFRSLSRGYYAACHDELPEPIEPNHTLVMRLSRMTYERRLTLCDHLCDAAKEVLHGKQSRYGREVDEALRLLPQNWLDGLSIADTRYKRLALELGETYGTPLLPEQRHRDTPCLDVTVHRSPASRVQLALRSTESMHDTPNALTDEAIRIATLRPTAQYRFSLKLEGGIPGPAMRIVGCSNLTAASTSNGRRLFPDQFEQMLRLAPRIIRAYATPESVLGLECTDVSVRAGYLVALTQSTITGIRQRPDLFGVYLAATSPDEVPA